MLFGFTLVDLCQRILDENGMPEYLAVSFAVSACKGKTRYCV